MLKSDFFAAYRKAAKVLPVDLPGGRRVHVRELSAKDKSQLEYDFYVKKDGALLSIRERLVVLCACDEHGERMFDDADVKAVAELPASVLDPIVEAARKLNGFDLASPEDARKNSASGPTSA